MASSFVLSLTSFLAEVPEFALHSLLAPLGLTLLIEVPIIVGIGGPPRGRSLLTAVLVNSLTNPVLVLVSLTVAAVNPALAWNQRGFSVLLALECGVVATEWYILRSTLCWSRRRALLVTLAANVASLGAGWLLWG